LILSTKLKVCPLQKDAVACDKLFTQIPLSDVKIIKEDFAWISQKITALCRFADDIDEYESESMISTSSEAAASLLPFAADIGLDASTSFTLLI
jgi:hypothetical protein